MAQYIIAYRGSKKPASPEEGQAQMGQWQEWVQNLGEAIVNPGTPLKGSQTVAQDGSVSDTAPDDALTGFTTVEAESMEAALEMAKACPFLLMGHLEVAQVMSMG